MLGVSGGLGMCSAYGFYGGVPLGILACRTAKGLSHLVRVALLLSFPLLRGVNRSGSPKQMWHTINLQRISLHQLDKGVVANGGLGMCSA